MLRPFLASTLLLTASLIWAARAGTGGAYWSTASGMAVGVDLILLTVVSIVGMLMAAARWARWLGVGVAVGGLLIAVGSQPDAWWWIGLVVSGGAVAALTGTWMKGVVRERPPAAGPPWQAVGLILVLLAAPGVIGAVGSDGPGVTGWVAAGLSVVGGVLYSQAGPLSLLAVRAALPALFVAAGLFTGLPGGLGLFGLALACGVLAWTKPARLAVRPLQERGSTVRMPAELTPPDILEAAGLDDRGRRKESR